MESKNAPAKAANGLPDRETDELRLIHAHETSEDMYATLDQVADKLERQVRSRNEEKKKKGGERASDHLIVDDSGEE